jgi:hypothetical protein
MYKLIGGRIRVALFALGLGLAAHSVAQETVHTAELAPHALLIAAAAGNVVASVGPDGALLVGTPSAGSTSQISEILAARTKSPIRYVVIFPEDMTHSEGDAGWGRRGAFVAMHENALGRLGGHAMGPPQPLPHRLIELGVDRPRISFSNVLSFDINGDAIHIVHQPPGYSDADAIAHFHVASLVYLGEVFPGDGYPAIDTERGGKLDGLLKTLDAWTGNKIRVVPARGNVTNGAEVKAFHDMIVSVRDRVQKLIQSGQTEEQIVAAHPTSDFDARWGHGRVSSDEFVREIYRGLRSP